MGLERYVANQNIKREVENQRKLGQSPITAFAQMMITDATAELISMDRGKNSPMSSVLSADRPSKGRSLHKHKRQMEAMIYFGNIIISMENAAVEGQYNHAEFIDNINLSIGAYERYSTGFPNPKLEKGEDEISAPDVRNIAKGNPTLSTFMLYPDVWLPQAILRVLQEQGIYDQVFDMAADYEEVTSKLIKETFSAISDRQIQLITLDFFDEFIEKQGITDNKS